MDPLFWPTLICISVSYSSNLTMITAKKTSIRAVADGPARRAATRASCYVTQPCPRGYEHTAQTQCGINANRGLWQLFVRAPLLTRDKDLSQPATRVDTTCWQLFRPAINTAHFYFSGAEVMSNYLTTDGLKKNFLYFRRPL